MKALQVITPEPATDQDVGGCGAGCACATEAAAEGSAPITAASPAVAGATVTYEVTGMTCSHCVSAVTEELSALDGVTSVSVELEGGRVTVVSDQPIGRDLVRAAVEEAGYELI